MLISFHKRTALLRSKAAVQQLLQDLGYAAKAIMTRHELPLGRKSSAVQIVKLFRMSA